MERDIFFVKINEWVIFISISLHKIFVYFLFFFVVYGSHYFDMAESQKSNIAKIGYREESSDFKPIIFVMQTIKTK